MYSPQPYLDQASPRGWPGRVTGASRVLNGRLANDLKTDHRKVPLQVSETRCAHHLIIGQAERPACVQCDGAELLVQGAVIQILTGLVQGPAGVAGCKAGS
jgi:hypothetical protein